MWYKKASNFVQDISTNSYGNVKIWVDGVDYTYYDVPLGVQNKIRTMVHKKIPKGIIFQQLKQYSNPERHKKLNYPELTERGYTRQEEEDMIREFENQGFFDK